MRLLLATLLACCLIAPLPARAQHMAPADQACEASPDFLQSPEALPHLRAALDRGAVRMLSIGSGSTVGEVNGSVGASFPHRMLEALQERRPNVRFDLTVQGGRGMTAETMLGLLRQTLPGGKFPLVIWQTGTVEAVHALRPDQLQETLQEGLRLVRAAGGDLILVDAQFSRFLRANADLDMYEAVMQHIDAMPGAVLFRRYELTRSWANEGRLDLERVRKPDREKAIQVLNTCLGSALAQFALSGAQKAKP